MLKKKFIVILFLYISIGVCAQKSVNHLVEINKVYNILKYSYPIKNFKSFDWDGLLVDLVDDVIKIDSDSNLVPLLDKYFHPNFDDVFFSENQIDSLVQKKCTESFYLYQHKGDGIDAQRVGFYPPTYTTVIEQIEANGTLNYSEIKISDNLYLYFSFPQNLSKKEYKCQLEIKNAERINSVSHRIAAVLKLYNIIQNFHSTSNYDKTEFDAAYQQVLKDAFTTTSYQDYYYLLNSFTSIINDGHANFFLAFDIIKGLVGRSVPIYYPMLSTKICNNEIYINEVDTSYKLLKQNDRILEINSMVDSVLINKKMLAVSANTLNHKIYKANEILLHSFKKDSVLNLKVLRNDSIFYSEIKTSSGKPFELQKKMQLPLIITVDSFAIIDLTSPKLSKKLIEKNVDVLNKVKGVIFNLTGYPNYNAADMLAYFTDKPFISPDFIYTKKSGLIFSKGKAESENWTVKPKGLVKNKYVFISEFTVSWGETLLEMVKNSKIGTVIGLPSADSNGDILNITLPIGGFYMSGLMVDRNDEPVGSIQPDINYELPFGCADNMPEYIHKAKELILNEE